MLRNEIDADINILFRIAIEHEVALIINPDRLVLDSDEIADMKLYPLMRGHQCIYARWKK